ncbi:virulence factor TspB C-terminal domain-related protein [Stenotrophomonas sp. WED208]
MPYADPPIPSSYLGQWSSGLGGGSCPAAKVVTIGVGPVSTSVSFEFKPLCDFAQMIRGLVIACAALAAAYIVSGVRK